MLRRLWGGRGRMAYGRDPLSMHGAVLSERGSHPMPARGRRFDYAMAMAGTIGAIAFATFHLVPSLDAHQTRFEQIADPVFAVVLLWNAAVSLWHGRRRRTLTWRPTFFALAIYIIGGYASKLAAGGENTILSNIYVLWFPVIAAFGGVLMPFVLLRRLAWSIYGLFALIALAWLAFGHDGSGLAQMTAELMVSVFLSLAALLLLIGEIASSLEAAVREATLAREAAEQANRAKSEFLARMSHDLRTPLNVVIGYSEVISGEVLGGYEAWARYQEYANDIRQSGEFLLALIDDILDIARIESGSVTLRPEPVDMGTVVADTVTRLRRIADSDGVTLIMAPVGEIGTIMADRRAIEQIVQNLVSNAIKFTPAGNRAGVRLARQAGAVLIDVWDEGIGIAETEIPHLGEPFRRIGRADVAEKPGTGLGIAIVRNLIGLHGGTITFQSAVGVGTTAHVVLPAQPPAGAAGKVLTRIF